MSRPVAVPDDLIAAIEKRRRRAVEVKETYLKEQVGPLTWVVAHPDDEGRTYVVTLGPEPSCSCPDFAMRMRPAFGHGGWCKHIMACSELTGIALPEPPKPNPSALEQSLGWFERPDEDDPFALGERYERGRTDWKESEDDD